MFSAKKFGQKIYKEGDYQCIYNLFERINQKKEIKEIDENEFLINYISSECTIIIIKETKINMVKLKKNISEILKNHNNIYILKPDNLKTLFLKNLNIDSDHIYSFSELLLQIIDHKTQPIEINILKEKEIEELLNTYHVKRNNLPKINSTDVLCKYYNIKVNDVIEIHRNDTKYYRLCI